MLRSVVADEYPRTLLEFERRFASDEDCLDYLKRLRWPDGFVCPHCGATQAWSNTRGRLVCSSCRQQTSVTSGTIFHRTRLPLRLWFRAIWHVTSQKNGVSAMGLKRVLGLGSYETAWTWLHKLRRAMVRPGRERLHGRVEADETYVGGHVEGRRGRGKLSRALVVIAAEEDGPSIGRIRMARIPSAEGGHLHRFIRQAVEPGSHLHTDGGAGYQGITKHGYTHDASLPKRLDRHASARLLPRVHRVASLLKRWILGTHQGSVSLHQLDYYLDEFTFRFNRRTSASRGKLFHRLLQQAVQIPPTTYRGITKGKHHNR